MPHHPDFVLADRQREREKEKEGERETFLLTYRDLECFIREFTMLAVI